MSMTALQYDKYLMKVYIIGQVQINNSLDYDFVGYSRKIMLELWLGFLLKSAAWLESPDFGCLV